jgi:hypothetical protein
MRRCVPLCTLAFALLFTRHATAQLQASSIMESGTWRGWVLRQDEDSLRVTWAVQQKGKSITIELRAPGNPDYGMSDVKLKDDVLTFSWAMGQGSILVCRLSRRGSPGFDGTCQDAVRDSQGARDKLFVNMTPPRVGGRGARPDSTLP